MRNAKQQRSAGDKDLEESELEGGAEGSDEAGESPETGGSPGVPQAADPNRASAHVTLPADMIVGSAKHAASEEAPPPKRFIVVGGPYQVAYGSMIYHLKHGRELSESTHPISLLRRQGVRLEPVVDPTV